MMMTTIIISIATNYLFCVIPYWFYIDSKYCMIGYLPEEYGIDLSWYLSSCRVAIAALPF